MFIDETHFYPNTIIDLVVLPGMDTVPALLQLMKNFDFVVVLDTQGHLHRHFSRFGWMTKHGQDVEKISYAFVSTIEELYQKINTLFSLTGILLIIDSITFVCDMAVLTVKPFSSLLWSLIYKTQATVITINHYKVARQRSGLKLVSRMGSFWRKIVSYQVEFSDQNDITKLKIRANSLDQL